MRPTQSTCFQVMLQGQLQTRHRQKFWQQSQRTTSCDQGLASSLSNAVFRNFCSPELYSTHMRYLLFGSVVKTRIINTFSQKKITKSAPEQSHQQRFSINFRCDICYKFLTRPYVFRVRLTEPIDGESYEQSLLEYLQDVCRRRFFTQEGSSDHFKDVLPARWMGSRFLFWLLGSSEQNTLHFTR